MPRFRKKPVEIEAMRLEGSEDGIAARVVAQWCGGDLGGLFTEPRLMISTLEGTMRADAGDWIIKGVQGEFYPCKPDIFEATYEPVGETTRITVYDAREDSWWSLSEDDRACFNDWLKNEGYEVDNRAVYRTEVHATETPFARVFAYALDEQGRKHVDPETKDVAEQPPHDVPLSSLPPVQPGRVR